MFENIGFQPLSIQSSESNGISYYVTVIANVINEGRCYADMYVREDSTTMITVRISDHLSGLEMHCNGVSGNRMTFGAFTRLIKTGAIQA